MNLKSHRLSKTIGQLAAFLCCATLVSTTHAQSISFQPSWVQEFPTTSPPARESGAMIYDASHGQVVLFGGDTSDADIGPDAIGDTWLWNGTDWLSQSPKNAPSARTELGIAYDTAQSQVVLYGGETYSQDFPADTWTWTGSDWSRLATTGCTALEFPAMTYDGGHSEVVITGFYPYGSNTTCVWNGSTWTVESTSLNPSGFTQAQMAYDAASGQAILFGGYPTLDGTTNQTWQWSGSAWVLLSPATNPPAEANAGMTYDPAAGLNVMYTPDGETWSWNGSNWLQLAPPVSPPDRAFPSMTYDQAHGQIVLFGGWDGSVLADTWTLQLNSANLGSAHVCPPGKTSPSPCSQSATLHFTVTDETIATIKYLTNGAPNLDFKQSATAGTCTTGTITAATECTVNVTFTPTVAGPRNGAVVFYDGSGHVLFSLPISGTGLAPQIAFSDGALSALGAGIQPAAVAVDGAGNAYAALTGVSEVAKITAGCSSASCVTPIGGGFSAPTGVAVDGAGNVYVADLSSSVIQVIPPGCVTSSCVGKLGGGFGKPYGVAVDGIGDVYVADFGHSAVYEMPAGCGAASCVTALGGGFSSPTDVAVDGNGNVYVADYGSGQVKQLPAGCPSSSCVTSIGGGFTLPSAVAVDAAANVYVADSSTGAVTEMPAACASSACVNALGAFNNPTGIALDGKGNLYIANYGADELTELKRATAPRLSFATTEVGSTSADSPRTVEVANIGNTPLKITSLTFPTDFPASGSAASPCTSTTTLSAGTQCAVAIDFTPESPGSPLKEAVKLTDNNLNAHAAQSIAVRGTATGIPVPNVVGDTLATATTAIDDAGLAVGSVTYAASKTAPQGQVISQSPSASTQVSPGSAVNLVLSTGSALSLSPSSLNFGTVFQGTTTEKKVTIKNIGSSPVGIHDPSISNIVGGASTEFVVTNGCPASLRALHSCTIKVSFIAGAFYDPQSATLNIGNSAGTPQTVSISALVIDPQVMLSVPSLNFGKQKAGTTSAARSVTITNSGGTTLNVASLTITGADPHDFAVAGSCPALGPTQPCTVGVTFKPTRTGTRSGKLSITDNARNSPQIVSLSGTGD